MFIQASQLLAIEIVAIQEQVIAGRIEEVLFSPDEGRLSALIVKPKGFFTRSQGLLPSALIDLEARAAAIQTEADLTDLTEMVRIEQLKQRRMPILGQKARTRAGVSLGIVADLLVDSTTWLIEKFYLQKLLEQRIIPKRFIVEVTPKAVIFSDELIEPPAGAQPETESVPA